MTDAAQREVEAWLLDFLLASPGPVPVEEVLDRICSRWAGGRVLGRARLETASAYPDPVCAIRYGHVLLPAQAKDARLVDGLRGARL